MHATIQTLSAVRVLEVGISLVVLRNTLIRHRKRVTSMAMRPATISGGMRKDVQDTSTNRKEGT